MKSYFAVSSLVLSLTGLLFFAGCASTPATDFTNMPGKFNINKTQNDLYSVSYTGTAGMTHDQAESIVGQRVSTIVINDGYRYFIVLDSSREWVSRPGDPNYPPGSLASMDHNVPMVRGQIRLFKKEPTIQTMAVYDAEQTQQNLKAFH